MRLKRGNLTPLFTQEEVWEIEKYNIARESWAEGFAKGLNETFAKRQNVGASEDQTLDREIKLCMFVLGIKEYMGDKKFAVESLIDLYGLTRPNAEAKVDLCWQWK